MKCLRVQLCRERDPVCSLALARIALKRMDIEVVNYPTSIHCSDHSSVMHTLKLLECGGENLQSSPIPRLPCCLELDCQQTGLSLMASTTALRMREQSKPPNHAVFKIYTSPPPGTSCKNDPTPSSNTPEHYAM